MKTTLRRTADPLTTKADLLVVCVADPKKLDGPARAVDRALRGALSAAGGGGDLTSEPGTLLAVHAGDRVAATKVAAVGTGEGGAEAYRRAGRAAAGALKGKRAALAPPPDATADEVEALVEGFGVGAYRFQRFRTGDAATRPTLERAVVISEAPSREGLERAEQAVDAVNAARDLSNTPGNHLTPAALTERAKALGTEIPGLTVTVLGARQLERMGAGALLAVAQGSAEDPAMIVMRYRPRGAATGRVLGLVGKAVTFDTGGISIKPSSGMEEMKMDMGGGAAVLEGAALLARLAVPIEFIAVIPAAENMPGGRAIKPGDVITAMNGTTIEVINTDAEGRMILADGLTHAVREGATHLVDFATLTGAIVVALGDVYAGLFGSDDQWTEEVLAAAEASGDLAWHMPMHPDYDPLIRSKVADLANAAKKRQAGPVYAAQFLAEFTDGVPFCHVDIAGTGMVDGAGTGFGVRLIRALGEGMVAAR